VSEVLTGRHAVVTGASRGIGAVVAAELAARGARVSLIARDTASLAQVGAQIGTEKSLEIGADITDAASVHHAFTTARARFGPVHILINNAGQAASAKFTKTEPALWNRILAVNVTGTYLCSLEAVPDMLHEKFGRIVNIASIAGLRGAPYISAYATSKHAVIGFTRSLALEYARENLTVNAICPGYTDTEMVRQAIANIRTKTGRSEAEALAALVATNPQGRLIAPAEIAHAVIYLVTPGAESVTGQSLIIAGGEVT
jgi:NAD(P)-dependent dehydrogenase (short-subunit alcohol dehydrogenase family)